MRQRNQRHEIVKDSKWVPFTPGRKAPLLIVTDGVAEHAPDVAVLSKPHERHYRIGVGTLLSTYRLANDIEKAAAPLLVAEPKDHPAPPVIAKTVPSSDPIVDQKPAPMLPSEPQNDTIDRLCGAVESLVGAVALLIKTHAASPGSHDATPANVQTPNVGNPEQKPVEPAPKPAQEPTMLIPHGWVTSGGIAVALSRKYGRRVSKRKVDTEIRKLNLRGDQSRARATFVEKDTAAGSIQVPKLWYAPSVTAAVDSAMFARKTA